MKAQLDFGVAAIGGKDSMSGSFVNHAGENFDVPPTLISFAVSVADVHEIITPEFKRAGSRVILLEPEYDDKGLPVSDSLMKIFEELQSLNAAGKILSCYVPTFGGVKPAIFKMCLGNNLGFEFTNTNYHNNHCQFIVETSDTEYGKELGRVIDSPEIIFNGEREKLADLEKIYDASLESIFPTKTQEPSQIPDVKINSDLPKTFYAHKLSSQARFLIPVFAGTNCEYETAKAIHKAGGKPEIFVVRTLTPELMRQSAEEFSRKLKDSQALVLPGGFSNGDEPDGSGKFIAIFLRSPEVSESVANLLDVQGGLICGICNGFQALVKTGLLPFGRICEPEELPSTLTFNSIGRHQSRIIRSRVIANHSPWLRRTKIGEVYSIPISHGEGKFLCDEAMFTKLMSAGQVAGQYVNFNNEPSMETQFNPSGSCYAIECLTSPDGRVLGRMGHVERVGRDLYRNVPGNYDMKFFESACEYFS